MKIILGLLSLFICSGLAHAGTGVGNFDHHDEPNFDFHIAHPAEWGFKDIQNNENKLWEISNITEVGSIDKASWLKLEFINNYPIEGADELLKEIEKKHPDLVWNETDNQAFIGFRSNDKKDGDQGTITLEYFMTNPKQVVFITERSHPEKDGALKIQLISKTIDRSSAPPIIENIWLNKKSNESYQVGEEACYYIKVNDFKGSFEKNGLMSFQVHGQAEHWGPKAFKFNRDEGRYEVCLKVTEQFGSKDLAIKNISLSNTRYQSIYCESIESKTSRPLVCFNGAEGSFYKTDWPAVINAIPDKVGPSITTFELAQKSLELSLQASDDSGVYMAQIFLDHGQSFLVYPDQLESGQVTIDLKQYVREGWNYITQLVIYDNNGLPTLLKIPEMKKSSNFLKTNLIFYELTNWNGTVLPSSFPVIHFLFDSKEKR